MWNTLELHLPDVRAVIPYKDVFQRLKRLNKKLKIVVPSDKDWIIATTICKKLEKFYKTINLFSGRSYPTIHLFFRRVCEMKLALIDWSSSGTHDDDENEIVVKKMVDAMLLKLNKYWDKFCGILVVSCILDPRNKMDCVHYYFEKIYGDAAENEVESVTILLKEILDEYQNARVQISDSTVILQGSRKGTTPLIDGGEDDGFAISKRRKVRHVNLWCELDSYLEDDILDENENFDILQFWKVNMIYQTLRKFAMDVLAIPVSTVASESAFRIGGKVVSPHRSRLHAKTVEALMCLQHWMRDDLKGNINIFYIFLWYNIYTHISI